MSKKEKIEQGQKISGKRVNQDKYMPLYEFLMFDPIYRKMPEKAKILYCFLRSKVPYFEMQTEAHANGIEGTKSYLDENGDIFILADNSELMYLLNCSEPTVIKNKKELIKYGLLFEEPKKDAANRVYVLTPNTLSEQWSYIGEIIELREQREKERKEKHLKMKHGKVKGMKKVGDLKNLSHQENQGEVVEKSGDLKNLSHHDLNNFSHHDLNNLSQYKSNVFNSTSNTLNNNLNPNPSDEPKIDIYEILWNTKLPMDLKQKIKVKIADKSISLTSEEILLIEDAYNYQKQQGFVIPDCSMDDDEALNDYEFSATVSKMLTTVKEIDNIRGLIKKWVGIAFTYKRDQLHETDYSGNGIPGEYNRKIPFYNWLEEDDKPLPEFTTPERKIADIDFDEELPF